MILGRFVTQFVRLIAITTLCLVTGCSAQVNSPSANLAQPSFNSTQLDTFVTQMMKDYDVPGVGLAIVENGEITYTKGYGVRDVTTSAPVTSDTQFSIGSVTKSFTALGMMVLVDEGLVDLDAPVTTYIPEFELSEPESTAMVTVRNLLSHTTGLVRTDASSFDLSVTTEDVIAAAATTPLVGKPGEVFVYSNVNTIIAGEIIKRVSGDSWETFTRERVLNPLGITTATLSIEDLKNQPDIAVPHEADVVNGGLKTTDYLALGADVPAGAVNASVTEMARYVQFQLGDGAPLLSQDNLDEMHKAQIEAPDFNLPGIIAEMASAVAEGSEDVPAPLVIDGQYGLYWAVEDFLGETLVQHGGTVIGETANVTLLPDTNSGVVILANADGANYFMEAVRLHIAELLLGRSESNVNATLQTQLAVLGQDNASLKADREAARSYKYEASELDVLAGAFESLADPEPTRVEVVDGFKLRLESGFQEVRFSVELLPLGENRFMGTGQPLTGTVFRFVEGEEGLTIALESFGDAMPLAVQAKDE